MNRIFYPLLFVIFSFFFLSCNFNSKPLPGEWKGDGISFSVSETQDTLYRFNIIIPYDGEYLGQEYNTLVIKENKFSSSRDENSFLGIPEANLEGVFLSEKLAKGTFNGVNWTASPVNSSGN